MRRPEPLKGGFPPPRTHLGILVTVFAAANSNGTLKGQTLLAHLIAAALTGGAVLLALAVVLAFIVRPHRATATDKDPAGQPAEASPSAARDSFAGALTRDVVAARR